MVHVARLLVWILLSCLTAVDGDYLDVHWVAGPWGQCHRAGCGQGGVQVRQVHCERRSGQPVKVTHCRSLPRPPVVRRCIRSCSPSQEPSGGPSGDVLEQPSGSSFGDGLEQPPGSPLGEVLEHHKKMNDPQQLRKTEESQQHKELDNSPQHGEADKSQHEGDDPQPQVRMDSSERRGPLDNSGRITAQDDQNQHNEKDNTRQHGLMDNSEQHGDKDDTQHTGVDEAVPGPGIDNSEQHGSEHIPKSRRRVTLDNTRQSATENNSGEEHDTAEESSKQESDNPGPKMLLENPSQDKELGHSPGTGGGDKVEPKTGFQVSQQNATLKNWPKNVPQNSRRNTAPQNFRNFIRSGKSGPSRSGNSKRNSGFESAAQRAGPDNSRQNVIRGKSSENGGSENSRELASSENTRQNSASQHSEQNGGSESFGEREEGAADTSVVVHARKEVAREVRARDVEWVVSPWSDCRQQPGATSCGRSSGVRHRQVSCEQRERQGPVDTYLCASVEPKPPGSEPCELECKQDCVVTPFSHWSDCDATCQLTNRTRTRRIVVPPGHGGESCPPFSELQPCRNCSHAYTYSMGEWGPCKSRGDSPRDVTSHLIGHQSREVVCLSSKGVVTSLSKCQERWPEAGLTTQRSCVLAQDCIVSPWSPLQPLTPSCVRADGSVTSGSMTRARRVLQLPRGEGRECPPDLLERVPLGRKDVKERCDRAQWVTSDWGQCVGVAVSTCDGSQCVRPSVRSACGPGLQSRRVACVLMSPDGGLGRPTNDSACRESPKPAEWQGCRRSCEQDCVLSPWSPWSSPCRHHQTCSSLADLRHHHRRRQREEKQLGKRHRTRQIVTEPGPGGQSCPHLTETQMCQAAPCFQWHVTYGACEATPSDGCGQGTRQRFAVCVNREGKKVKARWCWERQGDNRPWEECYVPCPEDCVLSEWGQWRGCPDPCDPSSPPSQRVRTRRILAFGAKGSVSKPCPKQSALRESQPCPPAPDCGTYIWKISDWTPCATAEPDARCGTGTQGRSVACYSSAGVPVNEEKCEEKVKPAASQACDVPCAVDCEVTLWSEWEDCGTPCRPFTARQLLPKQSRRRYVITYAQHGGSPCPRDLREERQCLHLPVCQTYFWHVTAWSSCILPPAAPICGSGLRARNVTCRHSNNTEVAVSLCLEQLSSLPRQVEPCWVTCFSDCLLSEWEPWGACVQGCHGKRFRWRRLLGESKRKPECRDQSKYPLDQQENCVCGPPTPVVIGDWSDCLIEGGQTGSEQTGQLLLRRLHHHPVSHLPSPSPSPPAPGQVYCGSGVKYKVISCRSSDADVDSAQRCSHAEYEKEACHVGCPVDCQLTAWSQWSACSVTCGSGVQKRSRTIRHLPQLGGRECPLLNDLSRESQSRVCRAGCEYHQWRAEDWGPCISHDQSLCGPGSQSRHVG